MKRFYAYRVCAFIIALFIALNIGVYARAAGIIPEALLSWTGTPETTQTLVWRLETRSDSYVEYMDAEAYEKSGFTTARRVLAECRDISLDNSGAWLCEAELTGLLPDTKYFYRVGENDGWSEVRSFVTAPTERGAFSFVFFGDIQVNTDAVTEYALWGELAAAAYENAPDMAFGLFAGDIVESGISLTQFDLFAQNAAPVFGGIPVMPANGNHESNFIGGKPKMYLDYFALPKNGPEGFEEEFYSFDYAGCHVTILNSWVFSGEQPLKDADFERINAWIENDLSSSDAVWKIVVTHHPAYAVHNDNVANAVRREWSPLFEKYGVSLVFVGHQHVYARSYPMTAGLTDFENGVTYIMGNSGQKFYSSADDRYSERVLYDVATYQLVRIDGNELTVQTLDIDGNELDYVSLNPRTVGVVTRAEFIAAIHRAAGSPKATAAQPFVDVPDDSPYSAAIAWAAENGIVNGVGGGRFDPDTQITAEHTRLVLARYKACSA